MTERYRTPEDELTISDFRSVIRRAEGDDLELMIDALETLKAESRDIEPRIPGTKRSPATQLLNSPDTQNIVWRHPDTPLREVYSGIHDEVATLAEPMEDCELVRVYSRTIRGTGEAFIITSADRPTYHQFRDERTGIIKVTERKGGILEDELYWGEGELNVTLAWIGPQARPDAVEAAKKLVQLHLPARVGFQPAVFFPGLSDILDIDVFPDFQ